MTSTAMGLSSPFASRLGTNYIHPDGEVLEIQSLLVEPVSRLKCLDDRIADLQKAISELNEEHSSIANYVEAHRALISPARRLPPDMLQEIFVACLPTHQNCVMLICWRRRTARIPLPFPHHFTTPGKCRSRHPTVQQAGSRGSSYYIAIYDPPPLICWLPGLPQSRRRRRAQRQLGFLCIISFLREQHHDTLFALTRTAP
jgi:hypothetical protein